MKKPEKLVCEAIDTYLMDKAQLGVPDTPDELKDEHSFQFLHEQINDLFATKAASLTHYDGVCAAFRKVHNYKYITDSTFHTAVEKEMKAQGIPKEEQQKALDFIPKIIKEVSKDAKEWEEQDAGFHPDLDDVLEAGRGNSKMYGEHRSRNGRALYESGKPWEDDGNEGDDGNEELDESKPWDTDDEDGEELDESKPWEDDDDEDEKVDECR